jgi:hypothetical protein
MARPLQSWQNSDFAWVSSGKFSFENANVNETELVISLTSNLPMNCPLALIPAACVFDRRNKPSFMDECGNVNYWAGLFALFNMTRMSV